MPDSVPSTVWFGEIYRGFKTFLDTFMLMPDVNGNLVKVPTKVQKADEDFKIESYPCTILYIPYAKYSAGRDVFTEPVVVSRNEEKATMRLEKPAVPYDVYVQIMFFARIQKHLDRMTSKWISNAGRYFSLPVKDVSGNPQTCSVILFEDLKKQDFILSSDRTFKSIFTYKVQTWLDEAVSLDGGETPMITITPKYNVYIKSTDKVKEVNREISEYVWPESVF